MYVQVCILLSLWLELAAISPQALYKIFVVESLMHMWFTLSVPMRDDLTGNERVFISHCLDGAPDRFEYRAVV